MWELSIRNIGGIYAADATVESGINVVQASNFSGKSSFMSALQTVMGTTELFDESHPLTEGESDGTVVLETDETMYEVALERSADGEVVRHGTPVLDGDTDLMCARLFAFLGEDNPIRSRVREREDLTDLLQAPLDLEDIDGQIATLRRKRESKQEALDAAHRAADNVPAVEEAITTLNEELAELRSQRDEVEARVGDEHGDDESLSDELAAQRSEVATLERRISRLETQLSETEEQLTEKRAAKDALDSPEEPDASADIEAKQERIEEIDLQIDLLDGLHRANQRVIEENELELVTAIDRGIDGDEFDCWLCGASTTAETLETRLAALQEQIETLRAERSTLAEEIETLETQQQEYRQIQREREALAEEIGELTATRDDLERDLAQATERKTEVETRVEKLEAELERVETELSGELTDIKSEIKLKEQELETQQDRLRELEAQAGEADTLETELDDIRTEIEDLKERKRTKQRELKTAFDEAMTAAIDRFAPGFDGARLDIKTNAENEIEAFDLVIARDGRETSIDTLSEGERELVGIVVALAGYRTFNVSDRIPLLLLDGISQLSADNLRSLCGYLSDDVETLVTTAYPEAGEFDGNRIDPGQWETVSKEETLRA